MPKRRATKSPGGTDDDRLHRTQLYHWMGRSIDTSKLSKSEKAAKYCEYLRDALTKGLRLKPPEKDDHYGSGNEFKVRRPICCFTETSVMDIADHTREYGSLGLGFPKNFVLNKQGMPVHYGNDVKRNPHLKAYLSLKNFLSDPELQECLGNQRLRKALADAEDELDYLTHFLKRMKKPPAPVKKRSKKSDGQPAPESRPSTRTKTIKRNFGGTLPYLAEREWRIVIRHLSGKRAQKHFVQDADDSSLYHLQFKPREELFTVVFPNYLTMLAALNDEVIRPHLQPENLADEPPVTLLSLDQIKTL